MTSIPPERYPAPGVPQQEPEGPSFWQRTLASFKETLSWVGSKLLGPLGAVLLILVAVLLVSMGFKELQIGGLLGKLLGKKGSDSGRTIDLANSVDKDRVGPDGKLVEPGTPDSKGQTQAIVVPIEEPGLFSNPDTVKFTPPGEEKPIEIVLPDGVKNKDVGQVVVIRPDVVVVTVKDSSGIPAAKVEDLLKKYSR